MDQTMKNILDDLVKGAAQTEGFARGSRVAAHVVSEGREEKLANHAALGAGLGGILLPGIGAPIGAAIGADKGQGLAAAGGSLLGGIGGGAAGALGGGGIGALLGALAGNPGAGAALGAGVGGGLGGLGGMLYGAHRGGEKESLADKLSAATADGEKAAAERFGVKVAFLPMLGAIAGPMMARAGLGALARGAGGRMLGGMASKVMPGVAGGLGGAAFDQAASMAGGALGNKLTQPMHPSMGPMG